MKMKNLNRKKKEEKKLEEKVLNTTVSRFR